MLDEWREQLLGGKGTATVLKAAQKYHNHSAKDKQLQQSMSYGNCSR